MEGDGGEKEKKDVRRPMNAFLIFCKRHRSVVREKNPELDNRSVTRVLGDLWANLGEEKATYTNLAKQYKDAFMKANPDYKWHNTEKGHQNSSSSKPAMAKPTNSRVFASNDSQASVDGAIVPGKLADPSKMGGLSLLLMADKEMSGHSAGSAVNRKISTDSERTLSDRNAPSASKSLSASTSGEHTASKSGEGRAETKPGVTLMQLAEMCSSELRSSTPEQPGSYTPPCSAPLSSQPFCSAFESRFPGIWQDSSRVDKPTNLSDRGACLVDRSALPRPPPKKRVRHWSLSEQETVGDARISPVTGISETTATASSHQGMGPASLESRGSSPLNLSLSKPRCVSTGSAPRHFDNLPLSSQFQPLSSCPPRRPSSSATESLPSPSPPYPDGTDSPVFETIKSSAPVNARRPEPLSSFQFPPNGRQTPNLGQSRLLNQSLTELSQPPGKPPPFLSEYHSLTSLSDPVMSRSLSAINSQCQQQYPPLPPGQSSLLELTIKERLQSSENSPLSHSAFKPKLETNTTISGYVRKAETSLSSQYGRETSAFHPSIRDSLLSTGPLLGHNVPAIKSEKGFAYDKTFPHTSAVSKPADFHGPDFDHWREEGQLRQGLELHKPRPVCSGESRLTGQAPLDLAVGKKVSEPEKSMLASRLSMQSLPLTTNQSSAYATGKWSSVPPPTAQFKGRLDISSLLSDGRIASLLSCPSTNTILDTGRHSEQSQLNTEASSALAMVGKSVIGTMRSADSPPVSSHFKKKWAERTIEDAKMEKAMAKSEPPETLHKPAFTQWRCGAEGTGSLKVDSPISKESAVLKEPLTIKTEPGAYPPPTSKFPMAVPPRHPGSDLSFPDNKPGLVKNENYIPAEKKPKLEKTGPELPMGESLFSLGLKFKAEPTIREKPMESIPVSKSGTSAKLGLSNQTHLNPIAACGKRMMDHIVERLFTTDFSQDCLKSQQPEARSQEKPSGMPNVPVPRTEAQRVGWMSKEAMPDFGSLSASSLVERVVREVCGTQPAKEPMSSAWRQPRDEKKSPSPSVITAEQGFDLTGRSSVGSAPRLQVQDNRTMQGQRVPLLIRSGGGSSSEALYRNSQEYSTMVVTQERQIEPTSAPDTPERQPSPESTEDSNPPPIRKSSRANRGKKYQALIKQGIIQPSRERMAARTSEKAGKCPGAMDEGDRPDFRRALKRSASDRDMATQPVPDLDGKPASSGPFDLEKEIKSLPMCSMDQLDKKQRGSSSGGAGTHCARRRGEVDGNFSNSTLRPRSQSENPGLARSVHGGLEVVEISGVPGLKDPPPGQTQQEPSGEPLTGSRKRKARKHIITRISLVEESKSGESKDEAFVGQLSGKKAEDNPPGQQATTASTTTTTASVSLSKGTEPPHSAMQTSPQVVKDRIEAKSRDPGVSLSHLSASSVQPLGSSSVGSSEEDSVHSLSSFRPRTGSETVRALLEKSPVLVGSLPELHTTVSALAKPPCLNSSLPQLPIPAASLTKKHSQCAVALLSMAEAGSVESSSQVLNSLAADSVKTSASVMPTTATSTKPKVSKNKKKLNGAPQEIKNSGKVTRKEKASTAKPAGAKRQKATLNENHQSSENGERGDMILEMSEDVMKSKENAKESDDVAVTAASPKGANSSKCVKNSEAKSKEGGAVKKRKSQKDKELEKSSESLTDLPGKQGDELPNKKPKQKKAKSVDKMKDQKGKTQTKDKNENNPNWTGIEEGKHFCPQTYASHKLYPCTSPPSTPSTQGSASPRSIVSSVLASILSSSPLAQTNVVPSSESPKPSSRPNSFSEGKGTSPISLPILKAGLGQSKIMENKSSPPPAVKVNLSQDIGPDLCTTKTTGKSFQDQEETRPERGGKISTLVIPPGDNTATAVTTLSNTNNNKSELLDVASEKKDLTLGKPGSQPLNMLAKTSSSQASLHMEPKVSKKSRGFKSASSSSASLSLPAFKDNTPPTSESDQTKIKGPETGSRLITQGVTFHKNERIEIMPQSQTSSVTGSYVAKAGDIVQTKADAKSSTSKCGLNMAGIKSSQSSSSGTALLANCASGAVVSGSKNTLCSSVPTQESDKQPVNISMAEHKPQTTANIAAYAKDKSIGLSHQSGTRQSKVAGVSAEKCPPRSIAPMPSSSILISCLSGKLPPSAPTSTLPQKESSAFNTKPAPPFPKASSKPKSLHPATSSPSASPSLPASSSISSPSVIIKPTSSSPTTSSPSTTSSSSSSTTSNVGDVNVSYTVIGSGSIMEAGSPSTAMIGSPHQLPESPSVGYVHS